jgi:hypothetical protein
MCALRVFEKKIVLCKKGDEITGLDGTQFPPPSSLLYGKMGSITLFFFKCIKYDTTFYA